MQRETRQVEDMPDLIIVVGTMVFFILSWRYVLATERL